MYSIPENATTPTAELIQCVNEFMVDLLKADEKRGTERVSAFVGLADEHDMFTNDDAIKFAMLPLDKSILDE